MEKLEVIGSKKLKGNIKISGSKNASLPILAATLISNKKIKIQNLPIVKDIQTMIFLLRSLGSNIKLSKNNNPPKLIVKFFDGQKNIENINCYSNDGGNWKKPNLKFASNTLMIDFEDPFLPRRGRINCSLNDNGKWRWFGTQFTINKN